VKKKLEGVVHVVRLSCGWELFGEQENWGYIFPVGGYVNLS
jgi:hypothetical protein